MQPMHPPPGIPGLEAPSAVRGFVRAVVFSSPILLIALLAACAQPSASLAPAQWRLGLDHTLNAPASPADWRRAGMVGPDTVVPPKPVMPRESLPATDPR